MRPKPASDALAGSLPQSSSASSFAAGASKKSSLDESQETVMRMMLRFTLPVEKSNAAINDGSLGRTMESVLSKLKPEAAYFAPLDDKRAGMIFFDMAEPSQIIEAVEPFFLSLNATTELVPVMNADDLRKGLAKVAAK
jgi:hypothetical protein